MSLEKYLPPRELWPDLVLPEECRDLPEELNLAELLLENHLLEGRADCVAIYFKDEKITYGEIARQVNRLGKGLLDLGISARDRVGIRMTNRPEAIITNLALLKIGAIPVPVSTLWSAKEIAYVAEDALLKALVVERSLLDAVLQAENLPAAGMLLIIVNDIPTANGELRSAGHYAFSELAASRGEDLRSCQLKRDDIAVLLYTSGTTGAPKGCAHTAAGVINCSRLVARHVWDLQEGDILGGSAPISFAAGFGTFAFIPFASRAAISLLPKFSPEELLKNIARHKITILTGIPTAYRKMLEIKALKTYDLSSLRICTVGSDALGEKTFETWKAETGFPIWENYGTTESFHTILSTRLGDNPRPKSIGKPVPGYEARVVDNHGRPCPSGAAGALAVRGPTGIIYWNPRRNKERLMQWQRRSVREGWNMVGDLVVQDDRANYYFIGREDDMIKSSGYRLSPEEIESVILEHPLVQESMVVGIPDEIRGQAIKAFVVMKEGLSQQTGMESEIKDYCRRHMALYKVPHVFEFVPALPKTATGKVMRQRNQANIREERNNV